MTTWWQQLIGLALCALVTRIWWPIAVSVFDDSLYPSEEEVL